MYAIIGHLDSLVRVFLACVTMRRGCSFATELPTSLFSIVNVIRDNEHIEYLQSRIIYQGYNEKDDRYRLGGYFFISIEHREANLRYPAFVDRTDHLTIVVRNFVRNVIFKGKLPNDVKVFMNLSIRQNCADFNILAPLPQNELEMIADYNSTNVVSTSMANKQANKNRVDAHYDPSGVLALVNMAYLQFDQIKKIISVKSYIAATFSSL